MLHNGLIEGVRLFFFGLRHSLSLKVGILEAIDSSFPKRWQSCEKCLSAAHLHICILDGKLTIRWIRLETKVPKEYDFPSTWHGDVDSQIVDYCTIAPAINCTSELNSDDQPSHP